MTMHHQPHHTRRRRRTVASLAAGLALAATLSTVGEAGASQAAPVAWHAQQAGVHTGQVEEAWATIDRRSDSIKFKVKTRELIPGNVYTLWRVTVNDPSACSSSPCTGGDVLLDSDTDAQVGYAGGLVAGASGRGTFSGHIHVGPLDGWLDGRSLDDPSTAEVHFVVNDHGPMIPGEVPDMIKTYRGGCSDESPFPGIFPPSALADGKPGPNECRLYQAAIFVP